jgi:hypothetical protein
MKIITVFFLGLFCSASFASKCVNFMLHNNTGMTLHVDALGYDKDTCHVPQIIRNGQTKVLSVKATQIIGTDNQQRLVIKHAVYVSINGDKILSHQHFSLLEEFAADQRGQRDINEELISKDAAYQWSADAHDLYFCTSKAYAQNKSCRVIPIN